MSVVAWWAWRARAAVYVRVNGLLSLPRSSPKSDSRARVRIVRCFPPIYKIIKTTIGRAVVATDRTFDAIYIKFRSARKRPACAVVTADRRPTRIHAPARSRPCSSWKMPPFERNISATAMTVDRPCCNDRTVNIDALDFHITIHYLLFAFHACRNSVLWIFIEFAKISSWTFVYQIVYDIILWCLNL